LITDIAEHSTPHQETFLLDGSEAAIYIEGSNEMIKRKKEKI